MRHVLVIHSDMRQSANLIRARIAARERAQAEQTLPLSWAIDQWIT